MLTIHCDGACEPNPGGVMAWAFVVRTQETGPPLHRALGTIPRRPDATNNVAEYGAVIKALEWLGTTDHPTATIASDSQLIIRQITGEYGVGSDMLEKLLAKVRTLAAGRAIRWIWVPRAENTEADALTRAAYRQATGRDLTDWAARKRKGAA